MTIKLKVIMQREGCIRGCCGFCATRANDGSPLFPNQEEQIEGVDKLTDAIKERYGAKVEVSVINTMSVQALWDSLRLKISTDNPAWVLGRKKIFEGIPEFGELQAVLDEALSA